MAVPTDRDAEFADWTRPHLPSMRRYAVILDAHRDPDDLVQDALERAWRRWTTYDPGRGSARTWLLAVVADRARRRWLRAPRWELVTLDALGEAPDQGQLRAPAASWDDRMDVQSAVTALPARQRQAVLLFYYVDLTVAECAALMGCADGTVKSTLSDARARLARQLGER